MNYLRLSPFSFFLFIIFFSLRFRPTFNLNLTRLACERNSRDADPTVRSTEKKTSAGSRRVSRHGRRGNGAGGEGGRRFSTGFRCYDKRPLHKQHVFEQEVRRVGNKSSRWRKERISFCGVFEFIVKTQTNVWRTSVYSYSVLMLMYH